MLAVSTLAGIVVVAIVWAFFAGPFHHPAARPQVDSATEASAFHQGAPTPKVRAPSDGESADHGGTGRPQGGEAAPH
jgi:hypothetical protein